MTGTRIGTKVRLGEGVVRYREAGETEPVVFPSSREDILVVVAFFGPTFVGTVGITALMLLGAASGATGGLLLLLWGVFSFFVCLRAYARADERERRERVTARTLAGMSLLAEKVVSLYSRPACSPVEEPKEAEVFALYRRVQQSLEVEKDLRRVGETIERGVALADELLTEGSDERRGAIVAIDRGESAAGGWDGEGKER